MKPITAKQWADALRSGKYSQTDGALCDNKGFCCLGVLAEEAGVPSEVPEDAKYRVYYFPVKGNAREFGETAVVPLSADPLLTDLDLNAHTPVLGTVKNHLMTLNDAGTSFDMIADEIERLAKLQTL